MFARIPVHLRRLTVAFIGLATFSALLTLAAFSTDAAAEKTDTTTAKQTGAAAKEDDTVTIESTEPDEPTFGVRCDFSHRNNDDPIVYPGKKGAAHSHDFFGNRSTKYNSTYKSLLAAKTTCTRPEDKSAYWVPTVKWNNNTITANRGIFYYRASLKDPATVKAHPAGLKVVPNTNVGWRCGGGDGTYSTTPPTQCTTGQLDVRIIFPDCSNGQLDSADHRSHMAYAVLQSDGTRVCPSETHPTPVPALSASLSFPIPTTTGKMTLSSGEASTMHADFFNAWKQEELDRLVKHCINDYVTRQESDDPVRPEDCKVPR